MKRILLFLVALVLLLTGTASADLMVYEYVTGEKVTLDEATGNYWYWNLNDFASMTYDEQIAAIADLNIAPPYGNIAGGWHMATQDEMITLFSHSAAQIKGAFAGGPDGLQWGTTWRGRYDRPYSVPYYPCHYIAGVWDGFWISPGHNPAHDFDFRPDLFAWVTTEASVVPVPGALILAALGLLTVGAKLRGRRRYGPSSI